MKRLPTSSTCRFASPTSLATMGMISVVVFDKRGEDWTNDIWLMSCRVLGWRVEEAILAYVSKAAKAAGAKRLEPHGCEALWRTRVRPRRR
jgi:predicted enzyme involved in methoxymalonyl-ACP biosynthesis